MIRTNLRLLPSADRRREPAPRPPEPPRHVVERAVDDTFKCSSCTFVTDNVPAVVGHVVRMQYRVAA